MKTNDIKRLITIAAAVAFTLAVSAGAVCAQGAVPGDGTVTDTATGLVWLKNANCFGSQNWPSATTSAADLHSGMCGLNDKSTAGQWRLPTVDELKRRSQNKDGFRNVRDKAHYWSSSSYAGSTDYAWDVSMNGGGVVNFSKASNFYVWPVRAGQ